MKMIKMNYKNFQLYILHCNNFEKNQSVKLLAKLTYNHVYRQTYQLRLSILFHRVSTRSHFRDSSLAFIEDHWRSNSICIDLDFNAYSYSLCIAHCTIELIYLILFQLILFFSTMNIIIKYLNHTKIFSMSWLQMKNH